MCSYTSCPVRQCVCALAFNCPANPLRWCACCAKENARVSSINCRGSCGCGVHVCVSDQWCWVLRTMHGNGEKKNKCWLHLGKAQVSISIYPGCVSVSLWFVAVAASASHTTAFYVSHFHIRSCGMCHNCEPHRHRVMLLLTIVLFPCRASTSVTTLPMMIVSYM